MWDTGAARSVISERVVRILGLVESGESGDTINTIGGRVDAKVYHIDILLPGEIALPSVRVHQGELNDFDILIGMDIISLGDFAVTGPIGHKTLSFCIPSEAVIDLTPDARSVYRYQPPTRGNIGLYDYREGVVFPTIAERRRLPWWHRIFG